MIEGLLPESASMASRRPLVLPELHRRNAWYGHSATLKRYAGRHPLSVVKLSIEHGVGMGSGVARGEFEEFLPLCLCASPARARALQRAIGSRPEVLPIGPIILYAKPEFELQPVNSRMLAFPPHAVRSRKARYSVSKFIAMLTDYSRQFDHVVACFHHADVLRGSHLPYAEAGIDCVTAGHGLSPRFLPRLRGFIERSDVVVTNDVGSHVFYALALGRPVWLKQQVTEHETTSDYAGIHDAEFIRSLSEVLQPEVASPTHEQLACAIEFGGFDAHLDRSSLAAMLDDAEHRYRASASSGRRAARMTKLWAQWPWRWRQQLRVYARDSVA
ncbi:hypothetical protein AYO39_00825 [Actinobacteria bacterium SCGC AG-212-D09]|nr:hypothetical protein AYO39_00825 [Actinobacteria bacterium SCGC AG-212-D09]